MPNAYGKRENRCTIEIIFTQMYDSILEEKEYEKDMICFSGMFIDDSFFG